MYPYPLTLEASIEIETPAATSLEIRAWELQLPWTNPDTHEQGTYPVPENLGAGYFAVVWNGTASVGLHRDGEDPVWTEPGFGLFSLDRITEIGLGDGSSSARVAVIGVLDSTSPPPALRLPGRGKCGIDSLPMPEVPNEGQALTVILRRLQLSDAEQDPNPPNAELWPRPGYVLTTIDGPQAGDPCLDGGLTGSPDDDGGLDLVPLATEENAVYRVGNDPARMLAYIIDFYANGDSVPARDPYNTEPGCRIRCWGS